MRNNIIVLLLTLYISLPAQADSLRLIIWDEYLSEDVLNIWQQENKTIESILIDNDETRDAILVDAVKNQIDLAVVDENASKRFGDAGLFLEVNETNVPSLANVEPFWRQRCGKHAVPYLWGTLGIAYRSDIMSKAPRFWKDLLEPSEALKGHIGMMNNYRDTLGPPLFMKGYSLNTEKEAELKEAFSLLKQQAPHVLTYEYPMTYIENSATADQLHMAMVYGGDQFSMNLKVGKAGLWKYVIPEEGTILWADCLAVTKTSTNQALALQFMDFINQPEIAAKNAEGLFYGTPNASAKALLSEDFRYNPEVFPPAEVLERSQLYNNLSDQAIKLRLRITNAVVNIYESGKAR